MHCSWFKSIICVVFVLYQSYWSIASNDMDKKKPSLDFHMHFNSRIWTFYFKYSWAWKKFTAKFLKHNCIYIYIYVTSFRIIPNDSKSNYNVLYLEHLCVINRKNNLAVACIHWNFQNVKKNGLKFYWNF